MPLGFASSIVRAPFVRPAETAMQEYPHTRERYKTTHVFLLTRWDILGIAIGMLLTLTLTCVLSRGRIFWEDEMLGWMLLHDPSWHHMLQAWKSGADGGGFSFYLTGRAWFWLFGPSELSFRLYSSTCFALAFAATWVAARRFYATGVVAFALFNTWFFCPPLVMHMREGRFYGLLTLSVSLVIWLALVLADVPRWKTARFYLPMFAAHALLITSHLLGIVFSASLLAAMVWVDLLQRRWRPLLYLCGLASWPLLLLEKQNILASAHVGVPHFWVKAPSVGTFLYVYGGWSVEIAVVLLCLLLTSLIVSRHVPDVRFASFRNAYRHRRPVYIVLAVLLMLPIAFVAEGLVGTWLFAERYLLPVNLALAYVTAELYAIILASDAAFRLRRHTRVWNTLHGVATVLFAGSLVFWDFHHVREFTPQATDYTERLTATLPRNIPVVCEDAFTFSELIGREHASGVHYVFLLDWQQTIGPSAPRLEVTQYHLMEIWRNSGYFSGSIEPIGPFLERTPAFIVVHAGAPGESVPPEIGNPLAQRFRSDPAYKVRMYGLTERKNAVDTAWLVCRKECTD